MLLIAPDAFKGTFSAREVATAIARGVNGAVDLCPVADGGEGTMEVVVAARGGRTTEVPVHDPLGRLVRAALGWIEDDATAVVETALASGLTLVQPHERDPEAASTFGTGELIAAAAAGGARRIVVTVGGSATSDGGAGAIEAVETAGARLDGIELVVACDVTTPFERAAEVYGAQKGADVAAIGRLTRRLHELADAFPRDPRSVPMTGAAGGLSGGLWARYGATLIPGASWVLDVVGFDARLRSADAVVTGEGRLDRQTFDGKLVGEVTTRCRRAGKPVHAVAGSSVLDPDEATARGLASVRIARDESAMAVAGGAIAALHRAGSAA